MLVLSRKIGEGIVVGDNVEITVVKISGGVVRVGINAPAEYVVVRQELQDSQAAVAGSEETLEQPETPPASTSKDG